MDISLIFKIAAVGILVSILSQVLKHSGREEQAFLASLAGLILVLSWVLPYIYDLFRYCQTIILIIVNESAGNEKRNENRKEEVRADEHDTGRNDRSDRCNVGDPVKRKQGRIRDLCKRSGKHCSICAHLRQAWYFRSYCKRLIAYAHLETSYFSVILKMVGITYIAEFASGICKDAGYQTIAGQIETFRCLGYGACFINSQDILNLLYFHRYHLVFLNDLHKKYTSL